MTLMHPAFPPIDSAIKVFIPTDTGEQALALIQCGQGNFVFRADTLLAAKRKARDWLQKFWDDRAAGKHKRQGKKKTPNPADASAHSHMGVSAEPAPSEFLPSDGDFSGEGGDE